MQCVKSYGDARDLVGVFFDNLTHLIILGAERTFFDVQVHLNTSTGVYARGRAKKG